MEQLIIYRIFHKDSQKSYIGKCAYGDRRIREHFRDFKNPKKEYRAKLLYRAMKKYGSEYFEHEIIAIAKTIDELNSLENEMIEKYESRNPEKGYNIRKGGDGGDTFSNLSEEEKIERRIRISKGVTESYTEEKKKQASETLKNIRKDPVRSIKNKQITSNRMMELNKDPNFRIKSKRNKQIRCIETSEIFNSIKDLALKLNKNERTIAWLIDNKNGKINNLTYIRLTEKSKRNILTK